MFRLIVAGSRGFWSQDLMDRTLDNLLQNKQPDEIEIVSGGARGADRSAIVYAHNRGYKLTVMNAEWNKHGRSAGYKRNQQMAAYADACVVFWDEKSRGSKHMIDIAKSIDMPLRVIKYRNQQRELFEPDVIVDDATSQHSVTMRRKQYELAERV
jgi:hypothetical protein